MNKELLLKPIAAETFVKRHKLFVLSLGVEWILRPHRPAFVFRVVWQLLTHCSLKTYYAVTRLLLSYIQLSRKTQTFETTFTGKVNIWVSILP